jgi:hypothetical protein
MRKFSRWMPPPRQHPVTLAGWIVLATLLAGFVGVVVAWPLVMIPVGIMVIVAAVHTVVDNRRLRRMAAERANEDIGSFARGFDRRAEPFDPWVVRAQWPTGPPPLRPAG